MKFRILVKFAERLFNMEHVEGEPRADMYLPPFLLAFGFLLLLAGTALLIAFALSRLIWTMIAAFFVLPLGIAAVMCWKNQTIHILSEGVFQYTTFLGNSYEYHFSDIVKLRQNTDSLTLFVADKKVHIESMAILSGRLIDKINTALSRRS